MLSKTIFPVPILTQFPLQWALPPSGYSKTIFPLGVYPDLSEAEPDISDSNGTIVNTMAIAFDGDSTLNKGTYTNAVLSLNYGAGYNNDVFSDGNYWYTMLGPTESISITSSLFANDPNGFLVSFYVYLKTNQTTMTFGCQDWKITVDRKDAEWGWDYNNIMVSLIEYDSDGQGWGMVVNSSSPSIPIIHVAYCRSTDCSAFWVNNVNIPYVNANVVPPEGPANLPMSRGTWNLVNTLWPNDGEVDITQIRYITDIDGKTPAEMDAIVSQLYAMDYAIDEDPEVSDEDPAVSDEDPEVSDENNELGDEALPIWYAGTTVHNLGTDTTAAFASNSVSTNYEGAGWFHAYASNAASLTITADSLGAETNGFILSFEVNLDPSNPNKIEAAWGSLKLSIENDAAYLLTVKVVENGSTVVLTLPAHEYSGINHWSAHVAIVKTSALYKAYLTCFDIMAMPEDPPYTYSSVISSSSISTDLADSSLQFASTLGNANFNRFKDIRVYTGINGQSTATIDAKVALLAMNDTITW